MTRPAGPCSGPTCIWSGTASPPGTCEHRVQGQQNAPELTDLGRQQAIAAAPSTAPAARRSCC